ncbi:hypothetical protein Bca4012_053260 [Brassica carinata]|uniref:RRM domain-containing protein n=1 Tax=Brassica carinata TaxID=52824 RepID=A0A8X7RCH0_BRACI|nr:hypothetical protein Bca52824_055810 [Brassica carinata]
MEEEEHEVYGGEIPDVGEMDGDMDMTGADDDAAKELDEMKRRLKEIEDEAAALREMQAKVEKDMGPQDPATIASDQAGKEEVDARSVFVGNVDYACTPEEVQQHFQSCGTVHRVTILTDKFGQPKGFAYVEFVEAEAIQDALQLNESELHGRQLKVLHKMETTNPRVSGNKIKLGIALPQFILDLNGESGGLLLLFTVGLCILLPLVVASIYLWRSSKYTGNYVKLQTRQAYYELMKPSLTTSKVMDVFIKAAEYTEIPVRKTDDESLKKLFTSVKSELSLDPKKMKQDEAKFWKQDPAVIKAELLIQKQLTRESAVLSPSLQSDFRRVLEFAPRLLEDLMKMAVIPHNEQGHGWLSPALGVIELSQCIVHIASSLIGIFP